MVVVLVVGGKEGAGPGASRVDGLETARTGCMVLHRLELRLAEGIVVRGMRTAVALGNAQVDQQLAQGLAFHRTAIVGMKGELVGLNAVFMGCFSNEPASLSDNLLNCS